VPLDYHLAAVKYNRASLPIGPAIFRRVKFRLISITPFCLIFEGAYVRSAGLSPMFSFKSQSMVSVFWLREQISTSVLDVPMLSLGSHSVNCQA
jgi:hypothetical protein